MLNKENYVPRSSRLLRYAKSRPNRKLIYNSIINGPYVRRMIPEPDIYAVVDSCETTHEIWLRVQQMMKGYDIGIQEKKAKLFNEWKRFTSTDGDSIESYYHHFSNRHVTIVHQKKDLHTSDYTQLNDFLKYNQKEVDELREERLARTHDPLALMANSNNPFNYPMFHQDQPSPSTYMQQPQPNNNYNPQPSFNQNYMQQPMPNLKDIIDPTTIMNMTLVLMAKAFKLNYSTPTNNNQRLSSNPRNWQIAQPVQNVRNQVVQNAVQNPGVQNVGNQNGLIVFSGIVNQNANGNGNVVAARAEGNANRNNGNQIRLSCSLLKRRKHEFNSKPKNFDSMAATADLDEIEEVPNANAFLC
ncbi:hypothetical protein Tco_0154255 [Tanacetum coccineum]